MSDKDEEQRRQKARIGYQTAIKLVNLVSQEIYSRFNAMLTANSIIIAIIGWAITSGGNLPQPLTMFLPIMRIVLCFFWFLFVNHGVYWQDRFRKEAIRPEKEYFIDTFKLISPVDTETPRSSKIK
jgi:fatty acid desaturase